MSSCASKVSKLYSLALLKLKRYKVPLTPSLVPVPTFPKLILSDLYHIISKRIKRLIVLQRHHN